MLDRYVRGLPWFLAIVHAIFTVGVFWIAIADMERMSLLPIIVFSVDLPASFLISYADYMVGHLTSSQGNYLVSGLLYLIFGTLWWFWIGKAIGYVVKRIRARLTR
jgi:hypothetical protein